MFHKFQAVPKTCSERHSMACLWGAFAYNTMMCHINSTNVIKSTKVTKFCLDVSKTSMSSIWMILGWKNVVILRIFKVWVICNCSPTVAERYAAQFTDYPLSIAWSIIEKSVLLGLKKHIKTNADFLAPVFEKTPLLGARPGIVHDGTMTALHFNSLRFCEVANIFSVFASDYKQAGDFFGKQME